MDIGIAFGVFCLIFGGGIGMLSMSPPEFLYARICFLFGAVVLAASVLYLLSTTDRPLIWKIIIGLSTGFAVFVVTPEMMILTRNKEIFESVKGSESIVGLIEKFKKEADERGDQGEHIALLKQILAHQDQLKRASSLREQFTKRLDIAERVAIDEHMRETFAALIGNIEARIMNDGQSGLIIRTSRNTFRILNPVPMRIAPAITFPNLPNGVTANIIENSPIGFTVVFTPPSIPIEHLPAAILSAEL